MDANKLQALEEIDYRIQRACGVCEYADIPPLSDWGVCTLFTYEHGKHSEATRKLSIHRCGGCPQFVLASSAPAALHGYTQFSTPP